MLLSNAAAEKRRLSVFSGKGKGAFTPTKGKTDFLDELTLTNFNFLYRKKQSSSRSE